VRRSSGLRQQCAGLLHSGPGLLDGHLKEWFEPSQALQHHPRVVSRFVGIGYERPLRVSSLFHNTSSIEPEANPLR
jgi:hypothetical protein